MLKSGVGENELEWQAENKKERRSSEGKGSDMSKCIF